MKVIFGKEMCSGCQELKKELTKKGEKFKYYDIDKDAEGLAILAYKGLINNPLPIVLEEEEIE